MSFRQPSSQALARARAGLEASRVPDNHPAVPLLAETWQSIAAVCADLSPEQWLQPTECPGWTVLDQVAHIIGTERTMLGHPLPRDPVIANHVNNELGAFNEAWVEHYRAWQGNELLMEFAHVTGERLEVMKRLSPADLDAETITPVGILSIGDFLFVRLLDCFTHEQDIRRALGRPGHLDGEVARFAVQRTLDGMPKAVARGAHAPDGSTVVFEVDGETGVTGAVAVQGGRGRLLDSIPAQPSVHLDFDVEAFLRLGAGRITAAAAIEQALIGIAGDRDLGTAVLGAMNIMP